MGQVSFVRRPGSAVMMPPVGRLAFTEGELNGTEVPALYVVGECDGATDDPRAVVTRLNTAVPRIQTTLVPGAGHDAIVAQPKVIAERVLEFLGR